MQPIKSHVYYPYILQYQVTGLIWSVSHVDGYFVLTESCNTTQYEPWLDHVCLIQSGIHFNHEICLRDFHVA